MQKCNEINQFPKGRPEIMNMRGDRAVVRIVQSIRGVGLIRKNHDAGGYIIRYYITLRFEMGAV